MNAETSPATPGWKLVPLEPTEEMVRAYLDCDEADPADGYEAEVYCGWKAMLAAAPTPLQAVEEREAKPWAWGTPGGDVSRSLLWCQERCWQFGRDEPFPLYRAPLEAVPQRQEMQKSDQFHFAAPQTEAKSLQPLTDGDLTAINRAAKTYADLMESWKTTRAYTQDIANLHATFKAEERALGRLAEDGLFTRIAAALGNRTPARQEERQSLDALHGQIMNLPIPAKARAELEGSPKGFYLLGHRDARHAAAELVAAFASSGSSEKEVGAAPLPVQGQEPEDLNEQFGNVFEQLIVAGFNPADAKVAALVVAALRASSAPTTKG